MDTKDYAWKIFNAIRYKVRELPVEKRTITFGTIRKLIGAGMGKYDRRTAITYVQCMIDNGWLASQKEQIRLSWYAEDTTYQINTDAQRTQTNETEQLINEANTYYQQTRTDSKRE